MRRFFLPDSEKHGEIYVIRGQDFYHLTHVLRLKSNDFFEGSDGHGSRLKLRILEIQEDSLSARIVERKEVCETRARVTLYQAIPKQGFEEILGFCTEIGVDRVIPVITERTVVKWDASRQKSKKARWERLIREVTKKVGRTTLLEVFDPVSLMYIDRHLQAGSRRLVPWELEKSISLKSVLEEPGELLFEFCIGPEGGFSYHEIEQLKQMNFRAVSLGKRILRVKTAAMFALSAVFIHSLD